MKIFTILECVLVCGNYQTNYVVVLANNEEGAKLKYLESFIPTVPALRHEAFLYKLAQEIVDCRSFKREVIMPANYTRWKNVVLNPFTADGETTQHVWVQIK